MCILFVSVSVDLLVHSSIFESLTRYLWHTVLAQRQYARYLENSSLCDLCAASSLEDVERRLLERPWEIGS
jgi:hypothetical protein